MDKVTFRRGDTYNLLVQIVNQDDEIIDNRDVEKAVFIFGDVKKTYPLDVSYVDGERAYSVRLSQEDTLAFDRDIEMQISVKFKNTDRKSTPIVETNVSPTMEGGIM